MKRRDWRQRWAEASLLVPTATLKCRDRRRSPTLKHRDWHWSPTLKRCDRRWLPMATLKCCDRCGLESSMSPLSLIGDGLSYIGDSWAWWRWWFVFFWLELSAIWSGYPFFFLPKRLLKCFVALGFFLVCWVLKLGYKSLVTNSSFVTKDQALLRFLETKIIFLH